MVVGLFLDKQTRGKQVAVITNKKKRMAFVFTSNAKLKNRRTISLFVISNTYTNDLATCVANNKQ